MRRFEDNSKVEIIPIEQDSDEWLEWRNQGVGSSDVALLLHPEPLFDRTVGTLWKQRVGYERSVQLNNEHIKRGKELEPFIRDKVNAMLNTEFAPACIERTDAPYLRASLDGLDENINAILEIKAPSDSVFKKYLSTFPIIPANYYYQMQYQMLVSNVDYGLFSFYNEQNKIPYIIPVKNNYELQLDIERRCALFWGAVQKKIPIGWENGILQYYHIRPTIICITVDASLRKKITNMNLVLPVFNVVFPAYHTSAIKLISYPEEVITIKDRFPEHRIEVISLVPSPFSAEVHETEINEDSLNEMIMNLV